MNQQPDIAQRLRDLAKWSDGWDELIDADLIREAAAEIEQLRLEVSALSILLAKYIAQAALKPLYCHLDAEAHAMSQPQTTNDKPQQE